MATVKYKNNATGKTFTGEAKAVERLKANPKLGHLYTYEKEVEKPSEPKQAPKTNAASPADPGEDKK